MNSKYFEYLSQLH